MCWLNISCTKLLVLNFFLLGGAGAAAAREEEKPWKEKKLDEQKFVCNFKFSNSWLSAFQLLPGYSSVFKLNSLLLIRAKCLMLWDHSEYHLSDTARGINSFFSFQVKNFQPFSCSPPTIFKPRAVRWNETISNVTPLLFNFFFKLEELICNCSSPTL